MRGKKRKETAGRWKEDKKKKKKTCRGDDILLMTYLKDYRFNWE